MALYIMESFYVKHLLLHFVLLLMLIRHVIKIIIEALLVILSTLALIQSHGAQSVKPLLEGAPQKQNFVLWFPQPLKSIGLPPY